MDLENKEKKHCNSPNFGNLFQFIDDLTAINDGEEFKKALHKNSSRTWVKKAYKFCIPSAKCG